MARTPKYRTIVSCVFKIYLWSNITLQAQGKDDWKLLKSIPVVKVPTVLFSKQCRSGYLISMKGSDRRLHVKLFFSSFWRNNCFSKARMLYTILYTSLHRNIYFYELFSNIKWLLPYMKMSTVIAGSHQHLTMIKIVKKHKYLTHPIKWWHFEHLARH